MKGLLTTLAMAVVLGACAAGSQPVVDHQPMESRRVSALREGERMGPVEDNSPTICRAIPVTGSRNPRRVCHTELEWIAMRRNGEETVRTTHRKGTMQVTGAPMSWASNGD